MALKAYDVGAVETLIGDIVPPSDLMKTLTDRKIAEQEKVTYNTQMEAQAVKQQLEQATALAKTQAQVVDAEREVSIAEFNAQATVKTADAPRVPKDQRRGRRRSDPCHQPGRSRQRRWPSVRPRPRSSARRSTPWSRATTPLCRWPRRWLRAV